jgi:hypothetical protein
VAYEVVEAGVVGEAALWRHELFARCALQADKEEASVPVGALGVEAVGEGVAVGSSSLVVAREPDVGVHAPGVVPASPKRSSTSLSKSVGPKPNVSLRLAEKRPNVLPASYGGAPSLAIFPRAGLPSVMRAVASVQARKSSRTSARSSVRRSRARKCRYSCFAVATPA